MEKNENLVLSKTYAFSLRIVKVYQYLCEEKKEYVLAKQLLRSGTSVGANTAEAHGGISDADFSAKISIAMKNLSKPNFGLDYCSIPAIYQKMPFSLFLMIVMKFLKPSFLF